ncbi:MAG: hypothetical protein OEY97_06675 [Nitrospirota bacterium]|nr:hypothetical protein [Nitrospirota bacterium]
MSDQTVSGPRVIRPGVPRALMLLGVAVGVTVYFVITRSLGVVIEQWRGIDTFTDPSWFAAVAIAPVVSGFVTGAIARHQGKWLAMLPVGLLHPVDYFEALQVHRGEMLNFGIFIFLMLVMLELALMAGWIAEILRNRLAGKEVRA